MSNIIRERGKTVDDAIESALRKLGVTRDKVEINVIDKGQRGFFGLFGARDAVVEVKLKETKLERAINFLLKVVKAIGLDVKIEVIEEETNDEQITLNLVGENLGLLIGHRGNTLDSLQYLTTLVANRGIGDNYVRVILDAEGYRERRKKTLCQLAKRLAQKAKTTGRKVVLEPMPPHERRIIHLALQDEEGIKTYSEGREPYRKVIIVAN
ncbi:DNA-binding protein [Anoxybacter fermentans]|uniref:RNA-binding protein KhpB n=1 Tax=Anoxybacter fermentans TaxID=1323375 RepID=A0A3S9T1K8_9FIRM|nr:RNA-binding cell elongation regulator Jag/EloR [Anoxybacter fermentans]AZR74302.1 DNA-binding protein [Anoxybacter fermentans]